MRIGFFHPFTGSVGGGDRYLYKILELASRLHDAELFVLSPNRPDPRAWQLVGVDVGAGAFEWRPVQGDDLRAVTTDLDLLVTIAIDLPARSYARRSVAIVQFPFVPRDQLRYRLEGLAAAAVGRRRGPAALASYTRFVAYSTFCQGWIRQRLRVEAEVIPPPVDMPAEAPDVVRMPWIVSVGRFRAGGMKQHEVLIEAFRTLGKDGWELHLAGTAQDDSQPWLDELHRRASGLRVVFHVNAPREEVLDLYRSGSVYWHAAGHSVDPELHPERLEHFGMTTVEAMAHGCVPLVVPEGGQAEIVSEGVTGRYWRTIPELVSATRHLIDNPSERDHLAAAASQAARQYDTARFRQLVRDRILSLAATAPE